MFNTRYTSHIIGFPSGIWLRLEYFVSVSPSADENWWDIHLSTGKTLVVNTGDYNALIKHLREISN